MSTLYDASISLFRGATDAQPVRTVPMGTVLAAIQTGAYRQSIKRLQHLRATRGQHAYNAAKQRLDAVTFGGTFAPKRSKTTLVQHSGLVHGDIDHLNDVQGIKAILCADAHVAYCFVSPSGDGLKLGVPVALVADDAAYKYAWQALADYYQQQYGVLWDPSGKDICRLCFVSWDPHLYVNPAAPLFPVPPRPEATPSLHTPPSSRRAVPRNRRDYYARQAIDTAVRMIDTSIPGNRHFWRCKAAYLLGGYVAGGLLTADEVSAALEVAVQRNTTNFPQAMKTIQACLVAGMQAAIRLEELERQRRQWLAANRRRLVAADPWLAGHAHGIPLTVRREVYDG